MHCTIVVNKITRKEGGISQARSKYNFRPITINIAITTSKECHQVPMITIDINY